MASSSAKALRLNVMCEKPVTMDVSMASSSAKALRLLGIPPRGTSAVSRFNGLLIGQGTAATSVEGAGEISCTGFNGLLIGQGTAAPSRKAS